MQGAQQAIEAIDVVTMAQERMSALMSSHKQAEMAFDEIEDIVREQVSTLNRGGLGLDLDVAAGAVDTASPGAASSKQGSFSQEIVITSNDSKVFSFLLFFDADRPEQEMPATGKIADIQRAVAKAQKKAEGPVLTLAVRDYNEIPPYQVMGNQGPVQGMTPSKLVASKEFGTKDARDGMEAYVATQIADMTAYLAQSMAAQKQLEESRQEIGFHAELKPRKPEVERPGKRRIGFITH